VIEELLEGEEVSVSKLHYFADVYICILVQLMLVDFSTKTCKKIPVMIMPFKCSTY